MDFLLFTFPRNGTSEQRPLFILFLSIRKQLEFNSFQLIIFLINGGEEGELGGVGREKYESAYSR